MAVQQGHNQVVAVLMENDSRNKVRLPAIHVAAKKDDVQAALVLLQKDSAKVHLINYIKFLVISDKLSNVYRSFTCHYLELTVFFLV